ncbi:MAG: GGDEF domain-containing protein [Clostridia bacterium]|nr:GGDEF domain-containing protein [Clostridia bacterium]
MTGVNLTEIYIVNGIGLMLVLGVLTGHVINRQKDKESRMLFCISMMLVVCCVADPVVFTLDGQPGDLVRVILYVGNFLLYLTNLVFSPLFVLLVERNTTGTNSRKLVQMAVLTDLIGISLLIVNFFQPLVFMIDEANRYQREPLYVLFNAIGFLFLLLAVYVYGTARMKGGVFKFFPLMQLLVPICTGLAIQTVFYGISLIWPCAAVGLTLMVMSMQRENTMVDKLTGMYNRYYLDSLNLTGRRFCLMMLDLNSFKSINDRFGHLEGDSALVKTARVLRRSVGSLGTTVRYAGDEFMILLNSDDPEVGQSCVERINRNLANYNSKGEKPYDISVSIGWGIFDAEDDSIDRMVEIVDNRMYEDKRAYYETHDRRRRS